MNQPRRRCYECEETAHYAATVAWSAGVVLLCEQHAAEARTWPDDVRSMTTLPATG